MASKNLPRSARSVGVEVFCTLQKAGLDQPESEQAILGILASAASQAVALGKVATLDAVFALVSAAWQTLLAAELLGLQGHPEAFREVLAVVHRALTVRVVPPPAMEPVGTVGYAEPTSAG